MSDDLIKKEEAKKAVCKGCLKDWRICQHHWVCPMLTNLEMLPSADRPQGVWEYTNNPLRLDDEWECSRCGNISFMKTNFCDRCGARMKGADDE